MGRFLVLLLLLISTASKAWQAGTGDEPFVLKQLPRQGVLLNNGWKFHSGDDPAYADPAYDDNRWQPINPTKDIYDLPELWKTGIAWFRLHIVLDSGVARKDLAMLVEQTGASEIYINGQLIQTFGTISNNQNEVRAVTPTKGTYIGFPIQKKGEQVLAIRFALQKKLPYIVFGGRVNNALALQMLELQSTGRIFHRNFHLFLDYLRGGLFLLLAILHIALFWFNRTQRANLYLFMYALVFAASSFLVSLVYTHVYLTAVKQYIFIAFTISSLIEFLFFLSAIYEIFNRRRGLIFWLLVGCAPVSLFGFLDYYNGTFFSLTIFPVAVFGECIRVTVLAAMEKRRGAPILIAGAAGFILLYVLMNLLMFGFLPAGPDMIYQHITYNLAYIILPVSTSVYLALEASFTSRFLQEKLVEVELLSEKTIVQEQEKQQILSEQKETLERQVRERTAALHQSLEDLKATQAQLVQREKMASLGEITAGVAHEIKNPLNFVNNFSEINTDLLEELKQEAQTGNIPGVIQIADELKENQEKIAYHGNRADAIVRGMLQHSRMSTGEKEPTDINSLCDEYLRLSYHTIRAKEKGFEAQLQSDLDNTIGQVNAVPQDLGRVLLNLFNNAFYATLEKKKRLKGAYEPMVSIQTKKTNGSVKIQITDNGIGIPKAALDKIFQPFFTTKPTGEGTGLGLSLSYDIITKGHSGELTVQSEEGKGATFVVRLPL